MKDAHGRSAFELVKQTCKMETTRFLDRWDGNALEELQKRLRNNSTPSLEKVNTPDYSETSTMAQDVEVLKQYVHNTVAVQVEKPMKVNDIQLSHQIFGVLVLLPLAIMLVIVLGAGR